VNNSINNLAAIHKPELTTYFIETHEWNADTGKLNQMEYFRYDAGVYCIMDPRYIGSPVHHTILSLAVF